MTIIRMVGRGLPGEGFADLLRRTGELGVQPTDDDATAVGKVTTEAVEAAALAAQTEIIDRFGELHVRPMDDPVWSHAIVSGNRFIIARVRRADSRIQLALTEDSLVPADVIGGSIEPLVLATMSDQIGSLHVDAFDDPIWSHAINAENGLRIARIRRADSRVQIALTEDSKIPAGAVSEAINQAVPTLMRAQRQGFSSGRLYASGDSLFAYTGAGAVPAVMATALGMTYVNSAVGGTLSGSIAVRQGGDAMLVTLAGALPADGSEVDVSSYSAEFTNNQGSQTFNGTLAGVPATLTRYSSPSPNESTTLKYTFKRQAPGDAVSVPAGTRFMANIFANNELDFHLIGGPRNDVPGWDGTGNAGRLVSLETLLRMVDRLRHDRFMITAVRNASNEGIGTARYDSIMLFNRMLQEAIGTHYADTRSYLASARALDDAGITPTGTDTSNIAADVIPASLRDDTIHGNTTLKLIEGQWLARRYRGHALPRPI